MICIAIYELLFRCAEQKCIFFFIYSFLVIFVDILSEFPGGQWVGSGSTIIVERGVPELHAAVGGVLHLALPVQVPLQQGRAPKKRSLG